MLAFIKVFLLGYFLIELIWPAGRRDLWLKAAFTGPVGLGVCSLLWFAWKVCFGYSDGGHFSGYAVFETLVLAALIAIFWRRLRRDSTRVSGLPEYSGRVAQILALILIPAAIVAIATFAFSVSAQAISDPYGDWDAWSIWNYRARAILRAHGAWQQTYAALPWTSHPDYPLMLPCAVARTWSVGDWMQSREAPESPYVPFAISVIFASSIVLLLFAALQALRSRASGFICAIALATTPAFVHFAGAQYADLPLAFFLLGAVVCYSLYDAKKYETRILALAGLCAGLAAWTKNEGLAFIVILAFLRIVTAIFRRDLRSVAREFAPFAAGAAAALLALAYFKLTLAHSNYLTEGGNTGAPTSQMTSIDRVQTIAAMLGKIGLNFGNWSRIPGTPVNPLPWIPMVFYGLFAGVSLSKDERPAFVTSLGVVLLMLAAYCAVYYITPLNLEWQMSKSLARLLLQIWPVFLFAYFLMVRPPEALLEKS